MSAGLAVCSLLVHCHTHKARAEVSPGPECPSYAWQAEHVRKSRCPYTPQDPSGGLLFCVRLSLPSMPQASRLVHSLISRRVAPLAWRRDTRRGRRGILFLQLNSRRSFIRFRVPAQFNCTIDLPRSPGFMDSRFHGLGNPTAKFLRVVLDPLLTGLYALGRISAAERPQGTIISRIAAKLPLAGLPALNPAFLHLLRRQAMLIRPLVLAWRKVSPFKHSAS